MVQLPEKLTISWLLEAYRTGALTPQQVIEASAARSEAFADWNIWIVPPSEEVYGPYLEALASSSPADADKPLWGVPFAIKDNIDLAGVPTTAGCPEYAYTPQESATVVERLVAAGAIPLGKANLDQFATGLVGVRSPYGECHNALDPALISGGSSSGSAVAVAVGIAAFALGTDTAGSGRVPAALNGIVGFKPPLGSWSTKGVVPACASLDCVTVFAHTLADARMVDSVVRGYDENCCWSRGYDDDSCAAEELPRALCIPADEPTFYGDFAERYHAGWQASVARIERLAAAHDIELRRMDCGYLNEAAAVLYDGPWVAERWADLGGFVEEHPDGTFPVTERILRSGARKGLSAESLFNALHFLQECRHRVAADLDSAVLVMPTCGGTFSRAQVDADPIATNSQMGLYTNHCNLCDLAALAVPGDDSDTVHPFGITAFSLAGDQRFLFAFARAFASTATMRFAVCGLHMRGMPLHQQMLDLGVRLVGTVKTAPAYRFFVLGDGTGRPGLLRVNDGGSSIELELYEVPLSAMGSFVELVPSPLTFGKVELADGEVVTGLLAEAGAVIGDDGQPLQGVEEITALGSYRAWAEQR